MPSNPFNTGRPVTPEQFVGRRDLVERIIQSVGRVREGPAHFLIMGPRRIGKTSLLLYLKSELSKNNLGEPIYIDCQGVFSMSNFYGILLTELLRKFGFADRLKISLRKTLQAIGEIQIGIPNVTINLRRTPITAEGVSELIVEFASKIQRPFVFLLDELSFVWGILGTRETKEFEEFAERISKASIIVGATPFEEYMRKGQPDFCWPLIFAQSRLGPFSIDETAELITRRTESYDIKFEQESIDTIYRVTGGFPFYVQALSSLCVDMARKNNSTLVNRDLVLTASKDFSREFGEYVRNDALSFSGGTAAILNKISKGQQTQRKLIKRTRLTAANVNSNLQNLKEFGFIEETPGGKLEIKNEPLRLGISRLQQPKKPTIDEVPGREDDRVFVGGNYDEMPVLREIARFVWESGKIPILAYDFDVPLDKINEYDLKLLHRCKYAIFEITLPNGHHYEIAAGLTYNVTEYLLYQARDERREIPPTVSSMLKTLNAQGIKPTYFGYSTFAEAKDYIGKILKKKQA
jgi:DNA polymerase III delta prime subunit